MLWATIIILAIVGILEAVALCADCDAFDELHAEIDDMRQTIDRLSNKATSLTLRLQESEDKAIGLKVDNSMLAFELREHIEAFVKLHMKT